MTISGTCPPHRWDETGAIEGIVLAKCIQCDTRQWHATDGDLDTWAIANKYNKRDHLESVELKKRRFMDTTLNSKTAISASTGVPPGNNTTEKPVDPRIARMRANRGNSERFDKLAPKVLEDVKTMTWSAALRKNGIPVGSAGRLRRRWEKMGLITKPQKPGKEPEKATENKHTQRDYDAEKDKILKDYNGLPLKDFYVMQHLNSGKWTELKKKWGIKGKVKTKSLASETKEQTIEIPPESEPIHAFPLVLNFTSSEITKLTTLGVFSIVKNWLANSK